nr:RDD family protein [Sediminibacillus halophilus]
MNNQEQVNIKTPEYVSLQFTTAGLGSRAAALIIDQLILTVVNLLIILLVFLLDYAQIGNIASLTGSTLPLAIAIIFVFLLNWGYFFASEFFFGGKTIGKRLMGIRVVQDNGHSITWLSSLIRNLMRIVDMLPASYLLGMLLVFFHPQHKRLGDIVAGTIVVHESKGKNKKQAKSIEREIEGRGLSKNDLNLDEWTLRSLGKKEWDLLKTYVTRFHQLPIEERYQLTHQMTAALLPKIGIDKNKKDIRELENILLVLYLILRDEWEFEW